MSKVLKNLSAAPARLLLESLGVFIVCIAALGVYLRSELPGYTSDAFYVSTHAAALLQDHALRLNDIPNLEGFKALNVAFESSSGSFYSKTGPWGGGSLRTILSSGRIPLSWHSKFF